MPPPRAGGIVVQPAVGGTAAVTISNSRINNNSDAVKANSTNGVVVLLCGDSTLLDNVGSGISSNAGNTLFVMSDRNTISLSSGASSLVRIQSSSIFANGTGVASAGRGVLKSYKNNAINGNGNGNADRAGVLELTT